MKKVSLDHEKVLQSQYNSFVLYSVKGLVSPRVVFVNRELNERERENKSSQILV